MNFWLKYERKDNKVWNGLKKAIYLIKGFIGENSNKNTCNINSKRYMPVKIKYLYTWFLTGK